MRRTTFSFIGSILVAGLAIALIGPRVLAQDRGEPLEPKTGTCNPNLRISAGTGVNHFSFCLSNEGNVVELISPFGFNHQLGYEGYRLCTPAGNYWDLGNLGQSGFGPALVSQPNGPNKLPITITRNTSNLQWELVQQYAFDKTEHDMTITMKLQKLFTPIGAPVYLSRWSDLNVDGSVGLDVADRSIDAIYARQSRSISLLALTFGTANTTAVGHFPFGSADCTTLGALVPQAASDASGRVTYQFGGFNSNQARTVKFRWAVH